MMQANSKMTIIFNHCLSCNMCSTSCLAYIPNTTSTETMPPRKFDMINDIKDEKETWKLAVRVTDLWTVRCQSKASHIEGIFMDEKGDKIQIKTVSADIEYWNEMLKEDVTYIVHNVGVKPNDLDYKACEHPFRLDLTKGTNLKQKEFPEIPENKYKFKDFEEILSGKVSVTQLVDVIGEFHRTIHTQPIPPKNKVVIAMRNLGGVMLNCTLWGEHATKCPSFTESKASGPIIILLTQARIRDSEGKYPVSISNSMFGSKLHINENVPAIQEFTASLGSCQHSESQSQGGSQMSSYTQQGLSEQENFLAGAKVICIADIDMLPQESSDTMARDFDMISDINDGKETWKLAVRVTYFWTVHYQSKASHIEGIFMDKKA